MNRIIVVEGRDDQRAVLRAYPGAGVICTHGFGISEETWKRIETAYRGPGIIVLTDPDYAGEGIRKRILERFPEAGQAFLSKEEGTRDGDVGIENASEDAIRRAVENARIPKAAGAPEEGGKSAAMPESAAENDKSAAVPESAAENGRARTTCFTEEDLMAFGLSGESDSGERRAKLGKALGIGYGNAKTFLKRLNTFGITKEEFEYCGKKLFNENQTK